MSEKKSEPEVFVASPGDLAAIKAIDYYLLTDDEKLQAGRAERAARPEFFKPQKANKKGKDINSINI